MFANNLFTIFFLFAQSLCLPERHLVQSSKNLQLDPFSHAILLKQDFFSSADEHICGTNNSFRFLFHVGHHALQ